MASSASATKTLRLLYIRGIGVGRTLHSRTNDRQVYANSDKCLGKKSFRAAFLAR